ncbi:MAG: cyclase/dehydrase [Gammaproteobacteria bacterium]|nr:cyclase/dehydrase [Gammaproteobacteria bacterium]
MPIALLLSLCLFVNVPAFAASLAQEAEQHGDIEVGVVLDSAEQSGQASATVRIHARQDVVWSLITNCADALQLVPGLVSCDVLETAPDKSWQKIRQVLDYSWYVRKLTYEIRATYEKPVSVSIQRVSGDLKTLNVSWNLKSDGDYTVAHYMVDLAPGFWVPQWLVRVALRRDLPKMLRSLRARAELAARH